MRRLRWTLDRLVASDPGMRRLRLAAQTIISVGLAVGLVLPVLALLGLPLPAVASGATVALFGTTAVREGGRRARVVTTVLLPAGMVAGLGLAMSIPGPPWIREALFVAVVFVAVYLRRFGSRATLLGLQLFMGYFLALLLRLPLTLLPAAAATAVVGAGVALLTRFVLLPERPAAAWRSGVRALVARAQTLRHGMSQWCLHPDTAHRHRVEDELIQLNATALALGSGFDALEVLPEDQADLLRDLVLDVEVAAGTFVVTLERVLEEGGRGPAAGLVERIGAALDEPAERVADSCRAVADAADAAGSTAFATAVRRLAAADEDLLVAGQELLAEPGPAVARTGTSGPPPASATARADLGETGLEAAGSAAADGAAPVTTADREPAPGPDPGPAAAADADADRPPAAAPGLRPTTRAAFQAALAGAMAIYIGGLVAPNQWFWALITAYVVFLGTASRGELLVKASSRTAGTLAGVVAGAVLGSVVGGDLALELVLVVLCVFLAFYLRPLSYAWMTFFVTTMIGVLYGLLGVLSVAALEVRLVETVIGALAGGLAALLVLPMRTRSVVAQKRTAYATALATLLRSVATCVRAGAVVRPLAEDTRAVDRTMHELLTSAEPLGSYRVGVSRARHGRWRQLISSVSSAAGRFANTGLDVLGAAPEVRAQLAELAGTLADVAARLGDPHRDQVATARRVMADVAPLFESARAQETALVDLVEVAHAGQPELRRAVRQLGRLNGALVDLAALAALTLGLDPPAGLPAHRAQPTSS